VTSASTEHAVSADHPASPSDLEEEADVDDPPAAAAAPATPAAPALDERSREILAFERRWWRHAGAKEQAVRDTFGLSSTRYYQLLNALLDHPAALAHDPVLVGRLRRLRAWRNRTRARA
jgi:hypothetical protein